MNLKRFCVDNTVVLAMGTPTISWKYNNTESKPYNLAIATRAECALCLKPIYHGLKRKRKNPSARKAHYINMDTKYELYLREKVIFGPNQFICSNCHAISDREKIVKEEACKETDINTHVFINDLLKCHNVYHRKKKNKESKVNNKRLLSLDRLTDVQTKRTCGRSKDDINAIVQRLKDENSIIINVVHLFLALTVWYNNLGYRFAAVLFGYKYQSTVCYAIDQVINKLSFHWVPKYIGYPYWTAVKILSTVPQFVKDLYPDKKILGCIDATYLYKQHANSNFQYQKVTWSVHKHANLQKEHVWCTSEGWVVLVDGPYSADRGDGVIWDSIINDPNHELYDIMGLTDDTDCEYSIAADRGYTQVQTLARAPELLTTAGVKTRPNVKKGDAKQLTREQADSSRYAAGDATSLSPHFLTQACTLQKTLSGSLLNSETLLKGYSLWLKNIKYCVMFIQSIIHH